MKSKRIGVNPDVFFWISKAVTDWASSVVETDPYTASISDKTGVLMLKTIDFAEELQKFVIEKITPLIDSPDYVELEEEPEFQHALHKLAVEGFDLLDEISMEVVRDITAGQVMKQWMHEHHCRLLDMMLEVEEKTVADKIPKGAFPSVVKELHEYKDANDTKNWTEEEYLRHFKHFKEIYTMFGRLCRTAKLPPLQTDDYDHDEQEAQKAVEFFKSILKL